MKSRTYYEILGVSRSASSEEIARAKNALAKVYHPDATLKHQIDTTAYMQEILEAYRELSNPEKRKKYDQKLNGGKPSRVFKTFTVKETESEEEVLSFVAYWNAACRLNEIVEESCQLVSSQAQHKNKFSAVLEKFGKKKQHNVEVQKKLCHLSLEAVRHVGTLKEAGIAMEHWQPEAMNWVLVRWCQKQSADYHSFFAKYDTFVSQNKNAAEKRKINNKSRQFHHNLKKLLTYALEA